MTPISDEEFDRQLDAYADGMERDFREKSWKGISTIARHVYPGRIESQGLLAVDRQMTLPYREIACIPAEVRANG